MPALCTMPRPAPVNEIGMWGLGSLVFHEKTWSPADSLSNSFLPPGARLFPRLINHLFLNRIFWIPWKRWKIELCVFLVNGTTFIHLWPIRATSVCNHISFSWNKESLLETINHRANALAWDTAVVRADTRLDANVTMLSPTDNLFLC